MCASSYALDLKTNPSTNVTVLSVLVRNVNTGQNTGTKILSYRLSLSTFWCVVFVRKHVRLSKSLRYVRLEWEIKWAVRNVKLCNLG